MSMLVLLQSAAPTSVGVSDTASLTLSTESGAQSDGTAPTARVGLFLLFQSDLTDTVSLNLSDTANLTATEGPVDSFNITTDDWFDITLTEVITTGVSVDRGDTASIAANDTSSVNKSGNTAVNVTDTASLSVTDAGEVKDNIAVTDTASLTLTDSGAVTVAALVINVADDAALLVTENVALDVSNTLVNIGVSDTASMSAIDVSSLLDVVGEVLNVSDTASLTLTDTGTVSLRGRPVRRVLIEARIPKVLIN